MRKRLNNEAETLEFAAKFAKSLKPGDVVALGGDLGVGKSVFARAVMRALGVTDEALPSPTYTIIQEYDGRQYNGESCQIAHMDWYRLQGEGELAAIGVCDYFQKPWICLIEWPERAPDLLPGDAIRISLACVDESPDVRMIYL
ncbi:MAG: tRNA (adenosine(37)-N6)-threonylcarbamoyltransferase complex ATPase subunit type 1 TsaE [Mariprofundaceae bacterium]|nr:tRNA (adenosine(37)-N6)-threonylcarbamoyltransferase complex ATPase subunit type 1 TsaE [Mariprofundaceae bacterium]